MSRWLFKISASLLLATLLLAVAPTVHADSGGCGPGGTGWPCGGNQKTYWSDEQRSAVEGRGFGGFWNAMGEREREIFPNFYAAGNWAMQNVVAPVAQVAFGPSMQRHVWEPMSEANPDPMPGPWQDNVLALGVIGTGKWGRTLGEMGGSLERWLAEKAAERLSGKFGRLTIRIAKPLGLKGDAELGRMAEETGKFVVNNSAEAVDSIKRVSPVFRVPSSSTGVDRLVAVFETGSGKAAFYRSTGINSDMPGRWLPFYGRLERKLGDLGPGWFVKPTGSRFGKFGEGVSDAVGKLMTGHTGEMTVTESSDLNNFLRTFGAENIFNGKLEDL